MLLHRLREVVALTGFTRFEPITTDENGGLDIGAKAAALDVITTWLPAIENRGEGVFVSFAPEAITSWVRREEVARRSGLLLRGFANWKHSHPAGGRENYPSLPYVLLHSIAHVLMQQITTDCGYPLTSLKERIYAVGGCYGILIYTSASDAEGTLGGLVNAGRRIVEYLSAAIRTAQLCSNDPVCAEHDPASDEGRELSGAACHGCLFLPETSCEIRNDFLDRALVVPTIQDPNAAFFAL